MHFTKRGPQKGKREKKIYMHKLSVCADVEYTKLNDTAKWQKHEVKIKSLSAHELLQDV